MPDTIGCHGLEPVAVGVSAVVGGPVEDSGRDGVSGVVGPCRIVKKSRGGAVSLEILVSNIALEQV